MTHYRFTLYIVLVLAFGNAFGQAHIYDRYASRTDLEVAYLENLPLDSATSINATLIIAKDSAAWEWMKVEFQIAPSPSPDYTHCTTGNLRNKNDPTKTRQEDILDCCLVIVNYYRKSLSIFQYETLDQYYSIIKFSFKNIIYEND